jgi:hypothetical protein
MGRPDTGAFARAALQAAPPRRTARFLRGMGTDEKFGALLSRNDVRLS